MYSLLIKFLLSFLVQNSYSIILLYVMLQYIYIYLFI